jgi:uncharacterized BrkB/YihY/UPF0761 family membrane protein
MDLASSNFKDVIIAIIGAIRILIPILFGLAFLVFFWGLSKFILNAGNKDENQKGKNYMLWGVLSLFILLTFGAIIQLASNELDLGGNSSPSGVFLNINAK